MDFLTEKSIYAVNNHGNIMGIIFVNYLVFLIIGKNTKILQFEEKSLPYWFVRKCWLLWNLGLSVFSMWGAYTVVPVIYEIITSHSNGVEGFLCEPSLINKNEAVMTSVFIFNSSKFAELLDTIFLIFLAKPIPFLHWYHHIATLIYCWFQSIRGYTMLNASGFIFCGMNYIVHSIMYLYYAFMIGGGQNFRRKFISPLAPLITVLQLTQMFFGTYFAIKVRNCEERDEQVELFAALMYFSYILLFGRLFVNRFVKGKGKGKGKGKKE